MDKTYEPKNFEEKIYQNWLDKNYFSAMPNADKKPFTIIMPPPNITGQLHIGHALDLGIQDAIIRYKRMQGYNALYVPGTDHASIATEMKIVESMRQNNQTKQQVGRQGFLKLAYEWNDKYGSTIVKQQKMLGLSCDWQKSAFTMDKKRSQAVREIFVSFYEKGLIYRGEKIINWCPKCKTAISDAEVEFASADSHLWHIKYLFEDNSGFITIATTRPETILGDTAVAVNPKDNRYKNLIGKTLVLPLVGRKIKIIADNYVESDFGSGAVKITPAHDPNDFEIGLRHNLETIKVMDESGYMNQNAGAYKDLYRYDARKKIVEDLKNQGYLIRIEDYTHNVGHCYRCNDTIEPYISTQWFLKMKQLAAPAIEAVKSGAIKFIPKRFEKIYLHWMNNIRDWCISRQLWWGHRIPVWYCTKCSKVIASKTDLDRCDCGGELKQDEDVLDTWFSSALWPFSTLDWPNDSAALDYFYPTNVLVTGYDIIGFWVSRMIFSGIHFMDKPPFKEVLIHGLVRDIEGKKMSKSSKNGIDPLEAIDKMGADALRFSLVAGTAMGGDMKFSEEKLESFRNFMNKIWNAARFVLSNLDKAEIINIDSDYSNIDAVCLSSFDKWIIGRLNSTTQTVTRLMDKYEVGLAATVLYEFVWNEFCDWYIEIAKVSLYGDDNQKKTAALSVLMFVLREILKLIHPIAPFITAEIYNALKNKDAQDIMIASYPIYNSNIYKTDIKKCEHIIHIIKSIRNLRREMNVSQTKKTAIMILPNKGYKNLLTQSREIIQKLALATSVDIVLQKPTGKLATLITPTAQIFIPMGQLIDFDAEIIRLNKELENLSVEIERAQSRLDNPGFSQKAPPQVIQVEREKLERYILQRDKVKDNLKDLIEQQN